MKHETRKHSENARAKGEEESKEIMKEKNEQNLETGMEEGE
jgi:hypothetical protein